jgi:hypothetical protein
VIAAIFRAPISADWRESHGASAYRTASSTMRCGSTTAGQVEPLHGPEVELRVARERRNRCHRVHGEHDAQDGAQVAEVRQCESDGVLPYNRMHNENRHASIVPETCGG